MNPINNLEDGLSATDDLFLGSIHELRSNIVNANISVMEVVEMYLKRIEKFNPHLNALITVIKDDAIKNAQEVDNQIRRGKTDSPLAGIPYILKDLFCTKGILTSCGSKILSNFISPYDATVQQKLAQAGAVLIGKANMDEFAMGSSNENSFYGCVKNPWDSTRVPGGSSGGSATVVSARLAPFSLGSDTGGSIRQPASFTGITGLKPTYGRISRWGMTAFASSLDQCGPMAASAEDIALVLPVLSGFDEKDSTSANIPVPNYSEHLNDSIEGLTIGLPSQLFPDELDNDVASLVNESIKQFEKLGAKVKKIELPNSNLAVAAYYIVAPAEASANLSRFDGVRYGYRCDNPKNLLDLYERTRWEGFGDEVKRRIMIGAFALSAGYFDAYYLKAQKIRRLIKNDFVEAFKEVDVIMGPVSPTPAFPIGAKVDDPVAMYMADIFTIPVNLAGLPGMSIPIGFSNKLPVGLQIIGNYFDESRMLNVAHQYQKNTDWHSRIPEQYK